MGGYQPPNFVIRYFLKFVFEAEVIYYAVTTEI